MKTDKWYIDWQQVTKSDNEWQQAIANGTTNENDTVYFKEWVTAIKHKNRYATSRGGGLKA